MQYTKPKQSNIEFLISILAAKERRNQETATNPGLLGSLPSASDVHIADAKKHRHEIHTQRVLVGVQAAPARTADS